MSKEGAKSAPKRIRNTVSLTRPITVKWLHEETNGGKSLSDAVSDGIEEMLRLREEVTFLRTVLLNRGAQPVAQEETVQEQQEQATVSVEKLEQMPEQVKTPDGWNNDAFDQYS